MIGARHVERHPSAVRARVTHREVTTSRESTEPDYDLPKMTRTLVVLSGLSLALLAACAGQGTAPGAAAPPAAAPSSVLPLPVAVDGWRGTPFATG